MNLAKYIDHTILNADATRDDILRICSEAKEYAFASVCINPCWVELAAEQLKGTDVKVCTVVGFPLGAVTTETKAFETKDAFGRGAQEVDMVINIGRLKSGDFDAVEEDMRQVVAASTGTVKVILEMGLLTQDEKVKACQLAVKAGVDFVKTSTGMLAGGATVEDVRLMKETVGDKAQVKAAGGIRTKEDALAMIEAGATRIGASRGMEFID